MVKRAVITSLLLLFISPLLSVATAISPLLPIAVAYGGDEGEQEVDDLAGPPPEIAPFTKVEVPALPSFELPEIEPGFVGPRELRVKGRRRLGTEVKVKGYVTWIYDCAAALAARNPGSRRAAIQRMIDEDPTACERAKLALGDAKTTSRDASITVVEVPRPPSKLERRRLSAKVLASWPAVPKVAVGDYVVVTGQWTTRSPHGDVDSDGLLVYASLSSAAAPASSSPPAAPAKTAPRTDNDEDPAPFVITEAPLRKVVPARMRADSLAKLGDCHRAASARDFDSAIRACRAATATWEGNHLAWYTLASAHMAKGQWPEARATVSRAVALRPDLGMYQLYHGVALYEEEQQARSAGVGGADGPAVAASGVSRIDTGRAALIATRDALRRAIRLNPALWRAHFYLARTYRDLDDSRRAAEQLVATIKTHPTYHYAYVALVDLFRRWGYFDSALAFAQLGARQVPGAEAADLWIEVGMLCDERRVDDQALEAFDKALALRPDDGRAKLQRGQLLYRRGNLPAARRDLEAAMQSPEPQLVALRPFIGELLVKIAGKKR